MNETTVRLLILLLLLLAVVIITAVAAYILLSKQIRRTNLKVEWKSGKDTLYSLYILAQKFPPLKKYMQKIRKRIELLNLSDDWTISRKTMRFTLISLCTTALTNAALRLRSTLDAYTKC